MPRILPFAAACLALLLAPATASATLYGVESNAELIASDRTPAQQAEALDKLVAQGADLIRVNLNWDEVASECGGQSPAQLANPDNSCYHWGVVDSLVREANARRILILATVSRAPVWLQNNTEPYYLGTTVRQYNYSVAHYSTFMRALATRYRPGGGHGVIQRLTVWNEPNSPQFFKPMHTRFLLALAPRRYAQLYARSAIAIRSVNRFVQIAAGPTNPTGSRTGIPPITFIAGVQRVLPSMLPGTGWLERRYINAWAHNPYPGVGTPPSRGTAKAPAVGMSNIRDLFRQLDRSPLTRGMQVWATEFGYQTNPPDPILGIHPYLQARYMAESFDWLDSTNRVPVAIWYVLTDPESIRGDWQSGTYYANGRPKPSLHWWRRPISLPVDRVRRGQAVRVWARSNVNPRATRIAISADGRRWRLLPISGRRRDGTLVNYVRVYRTTWFATWDGTRGPARVARVR